MARPLLRDWVIEEACRRYVCAPLGDLSAFDRLEEELDLGLRDPWALACRYRPQLAERERQSREEVVELGVWQSAGPVAFIIGGRMVLAS